MKKSKMTDNDADDSPDYHAKQIARHDALASKHRAMADHHRTLHSNAVNSTARAGLLKTARSMPERYVHERY